MERAEEVMRIVRGEMGRVSTTEVERDGVFVVVDLSNSPVA